MLLSITAFFEVNFVVFLFKKIVSGHFAHFLHGLLDLFPASGDLRLVHRQLPRGQSTRAGKKSFHDESSRSHVGRLQHAPERGFRLQSNY